MTGGRDFKARRRRKAGHRYRGLIGLAACLLLALGIGAVVYLKRQNLDAPNAMAALKPAKKKSRANEPPDTSDPGAPEAPAYAFYDRLPKFAVVVPEKEKDQRPDLKPAPETRKGTYVLQAGTYKRFEDADRVRIKLSMLGIESKIQSVPVDSDTWNRIRIGPVSNLDDLNRMRGILRKADLDVQVIRVGD